MREQLLSSRAHIVIQIRLLVRPPPTSDVGPARQQPEKSYCIDLCVRKGQGHSRRSARTLYIRRGGARGIVSTMGEIVSRLAGHKQARQAGESDCQRTTPGSEIKKGTPKKSRGRPRNVACFGSVRQARIHCLKHPRVARWKGLAQLSKLRKRRL
jgi:hypothetical protein